jgi:hypothetical protein
MRISSKAAIVAGVLTADAAIHLYWATGATWPARTPGSLSRAVLNMDVPFTPPTLLPLVGVLLAGSGLLVARAGGRGGRTAALGSGALGAGIALRGAAGLVWATGLGTDTATPFYWLNLLAYTPACLLLAPLALAVARGEEAAGAGSPAVRPEPGLSGR